jgi:putative transposase
MRLLHAKIAKTLRTRDLKDVKVFRNRKDLKDFLDRVADLCRPEAVRTYGWALISTHFHLILGTDKQPLTNSMRRLLTRYVVNYNRRHNWYGHLFQNR